MESVEPLSEFDLARQKVYKGLVNENPLPEFQDKACKRLGQPELFYPEKGVRPTQAKEVCMGCGDLLPCRKWAIDTDEKWGVWGATTPSERKEIRKLLYG